MPNVPLYPAKIIFKPAGGENLTAHAGPRYK